jgi:uncharacterized protein YbaP (TraB family)
MSGRSNKARRRWLALVLGLLLGSIAAPLGAQEDAGYAAYERGDYAAALQEWRAEAEAGSAQAQYNLAVLYDLGQGVAPDKVQAALWYREAAVQGLAAAQFNLAAMLAGGEGLGRDPVRAYMLYDLAAESDAEAAAERDRLAAAMAPGEIGQGARLARWARQGESAEIIREALNGILPGDEYTPAQLDFLEAELTAPAQRALAELGYDPGPADGVPGPATRDAVRAFQAEAGLPVDGEINQGLLDHLARAFDRHLAAQGLRHGQGRLWRVEGPEAPASHVFGTMHVSDPRVLDLPGPIWQAFRNARTVALEIDFSGGREQALEIARAFFEAMVLTDGRTLDQIVGPDLFADTQAALRPYGVSAELLKRMRPWAVYEILVNPANAFRGRGDETPFLDLSLAQEAENRGKPLYGLETVDEQLAVFADMPEQDQVALLESAIAYAGEQDMGLEALTQLYLAGDLAAIQRLWFEPARRLGPDFVVQVVTRLIDDRNEVMVARMQGLLARGGAFVAVGAAHLPGDMGVLHLLERQGYRVTRVY